MRKMEVLHLSYIPLNPGWVLTLMTRINQSTSRTLRDRKAKWDKLLPGDEVSLGDLALSVTSKRNMLPFVERRLDNRLKALHEYLKDEARIEDCLLHGAGYKVRDDNVVWELLLDLDAFFFEAQSAFETLDRFLVRFCRLILGRSIKGGGEGEAVRPAFSI